MSKIVQQFVQIDATQQLFIQYAIAEPILRLCIPRFGVLLTLFNYYYY